MTVPGLDINFKKNPSHQNKKKESAGKNKTKTTIPNFSQSSGEVVRVLGQSQEPHPGPDKDALPQPHPRQFNGLSFTLTSSSLKQQPFNYFLSFRNILLVELRV